MGEAAFFDSNTSRHAFTGKVVSFNLYVILVNPEWVRIECLV